MTYDVRVVDWMTQADERILEWLVGEEPQPPRAIHSELDDLGVEYSRPHISRRCHELADHGLLNRQYDNFAISSKGKAVLNRELDVSTLSD